MKTLLCLLVAASSAMLGCAYEAQEFEGDEEVGLAEGAFMEENSLDENGLDKNGLDKNGLDKNGLALSNIIDTNSTPADIIATLSADTAEGGYARKFMKYLINCALPAGQTRTFDWTDSSSTVHHEVFQGSFGIAPSFGQGGGQGMTTEDQELLSSCIASRTNYYGVTVTVSFRGNRSGKFATDTTERNEYNKAEGVFFGNLWATPPVLRSCYFGANVSNSRAALRECATKHSDGDECGSIVSLGDCETVCGTASNTNADGAILTCGSYSNVITTFLPTVN